MKPRHFDQSKSNWSGHTYTKPVHAPCIHSGFKLFTHIYILFFFCTKATSIFEQYRPFAWWFTFNEIYIIKFITVHISWTKIKTRRIWGEQKPSNCISEKANGTDMHTHITVNRIIGNLLFSEWSLEFGKCIHINKILTIIIGSLHMCTTMSGFIKKKHVCVQQLTRHIPYCTFCYSPQTAFRPSIHISWWYVASCIHYQLCYKLSYEIWLYFVNWKTQTKSRQNENVSWMVFRWILQFGHCVKFKFKRKMTLASI